jgi:uncharacterized membrane protein YkoI
MKSNHPVKLAGICMIATMAYGSANAGEKAIVDTCVKAAQAQYSGDMVKMEKKIEENKTVYEFEIKGKDSSKEFECDAGTGKITESEIEVDSPEDPRFKAKAKITLDQAKDIALKKHRGNIVETEFEIESDGRASYEFDIKGADGQEVKIEIDAETGKIAEDDEKEIYQIGKE